MDPGQLSVDTEQIELQVNNGATPSLQLTPSQLYASLPVSENRTIRLLDLDGLPSESDTDEVPLIGTLRVVSLATSPCFAALSYVWGEYSKPDRDTLEIRHDGGQNTKLEITANCRDALRSLRRMHGPLCIWVDTICINQPDNIEKESQISLMEEIYSWAVPVYAWLGPSTDASDRAMKWLSRVVPEIDVKDIVSIMNNTQKSRIERYFIMVWHMLVMFAVQLVQAGHMWRQWPPLPVTLLKIIFKMDSNTSHILSLIHSNQGLTGQLQSNNISDILDDISDILDREWFYRAWTFQEVVLSPNIVILCGFNELAWTKFIADIRIHAKSMARLADISRMHWLLDLINIWMVTERPVTWNEGAGNRGVTRSTYATWTVGMRQSWYIPGIMRLFLGSIHLFSVLLHLSILISITFYLIETIPLVLFFLFFKELFIFFAWFTPLVASWMSILIAPGSGIELLKFVYFEIVIGFESEFEGAHDAYYAGVVQAIRTRRATDAKDHAYSAYGVLQRLGVKKLASPDYSKPLGQVYQELTVDLLRWRPALLSLIVDAGTGYHLQCPSWVPDWRHAASKQWIDTGYVLNKVPGINSLVGPVTLPPSPSVEFRGQQELVIKGIRKGAVSFCSGPFHKITTGQEQVGLNVATSSFIRWFACLRKDLKADRFITKSKPIYYVVKRVLDSYIDNTRLKIPVQDLYTWLTTFNTTKLALRVHASLDVQGKGSGLIDDDGEQLYTTHPHGHTNRQVTINMCNHLAGRRNLFITTKGLAGSGPELMIPGDSVVLIAGVSVPMILRQVVSRESRTTESLKYRVIGAAYIDGLMGGEAFTTQDLEEIVLV
ncbi:heterokaryon incompatibility protein-domain-containing protein [Hypoxylon fuscum]|nr:heterokaryon incompatibility protein-domain-containing protein [Hypoxylon fuscum]